MAVQVRQGLPLYSGSVIGSTTGLISLTARLAISAGSIPAPSTNLEGRKAGVLIGLENREGRKAVRVRSSCLPPSVCKSAADTPAWNWDDVGSSPTTLTNYWGCRTGRTLALQAGRLGSLPSTSTNIARWCNSNINGS
jgi:hypothetical protein